MRPATLALLALPLAACVDTVSGFGGRGGAVPTPDPIPAGQIRVATVSARPSAVTITLSDGTRCVSARPEGVPSGWSGTTSDCPYAIPYVVTFARGGDPSRFTVERPGGAITRDGTPGPRAEVFVTDLDGVRRLFVVPLPERVFGDAPAT